MVSIFFCPICGKLQSRVIVVAPTAVIFPARRASPLKVCAVLNTMPSLGSCLQLKDDSGSSNSNFLLFGIRSSAVILWLTWSPLDKHNIFLKSGSVESLLISSSLIYTPQKPVVKQLKDCLNRMIWFLISIFCAPFGLLVKRTITISIYLLK